MLLLFISTIYAAPTNWKKFNTQSDGLKSFQNLTYDIKNKYLLLPIQEDAGEFKTRIYVDGKFEVVLDIRYAKDKVTYIFPLNTTNWIGKKVVINIDVGDNDISKYVFWNNLNESDEYQYNYNYYEQYRPWYHFTPEHGWMNDPNGMFSTSNLYHFHYQYNPYAAVWGNMHWGHAISTDLLHWKYLPFSISPDDLGQIFSGSSVVDDENLAGYGEKAVFSYYTSAGAHQQQSLAFSKDNGFTFTKYEKNPIVPNTEMPDFRDPKVIKLKKNGEVFYIMCLAAGDHIDFYSSKDLLSWSYKSSFGQNYGTHGGVWECPDLLYFEEFNKFILFVNVNPGGPFGGSACQYFIGQFDGEKFTCDDSPETIRWLEYGKDAYATVTYPKEANLKAVKENGRTEYIAITWMSNWQYAAIVPSINYRSSATIPRKISLMQLNGGDLKFSASNLPFDDINSIREESTKTNSFSIPNGEMQKEFKDILKDGQAFEVDFKFIIDQTSTVGIKFTNDKNEEYVIQFDPSTKTVSCDRTKSGIVSFSNDFPCVTKATIPLEKNIYKWRFFIDACSIEFFDEDGLATMTNLVYPTVPYSNIVVFKSSSEGTLSVEPIEIFPLKKIMHPMGKDDDKPKKDSHKTLIIICSVVGGVAVIAVVVLIVVLVVLKKKKSNGTLDLESKKESALLNENNQ